MKHKNNALFVDREINLESGAAAIQASAAAAVQNVIRGLKSNKSDDKVSILPDVSNKNFKAI